MANTLTTLLLNSLLFLQGGEDQELAVLAHHPLLNPLL